MDYLHFAASLEDSTRRSNESYVTILIPRAFEPHLLVPDTSLTSRIAEWILGARPLGTKSNRQPIESSCGDATTSVEIRRTPN